MYCKNCGKELADGTAFCPDCGTSVSGTPTTPARQTSNSDSKGMGIIAYLFGWIGLIIAFCAGNKDDEFMKFHLNQALILDICSIIVIIPAIGWIIWIVTLVFRIIGLIGAAQGEMKPLPLIGGIQIIK